MFFVFALAKNCWWRTLCDNELTSIPENLFEGLKSLRDMWEIVFLGNSFELFGQMVVEELAHKSTWVHFSRIDKPAKLVTNDRFSFFCWPFPSRFLGVNRLTSVPENLFRGLPQLQEMSVLEWFQRFDLFASFSYLTGNQLTTLPEDVFQGLTTLRTMCVWLPLSFWSLFFCIL